MKSIDIWKKASAEIKEDKKKKVISQIGEDLILIQERMLELGYEDRIKQEDIMWDIVDAIDHGNNYLIEAGVGIGKSFAYLIPGVLLSRYTGKPLIVATSTIPLSEQLEDDIAHVEYVLKPILDSDSIDVVVGKGRTNYPCVHKIEKLILKYRKSDSKRVTEYESILKKVEAGADRQNKMGIKDQYWDQITEHTCERDYLFNKKNCPLHQMRSDLTIPLNLSKSPMKNGIKLYVPKVLTINQDLLMGHIKNIIEDGRRLLPKQFPMLIVDEVHNLEEKARSSLTYMIDKKFTEKTFEDLNMLYNQMSQQSFRRNEIKKIQKQVNNFFKEIRKQLINEAKEVQYDGSAENLFIKEPSKEYKKLESDILNLLRNIEIDVLYHGSFNKKTERVSESIITDLKIIADFINSCFTNTKENIIWGSISKDEYCKVFYCPDQVSKYLNTYLFNRNFITVGLSATVTILDDNYKQSYEYIKANIGFEGEVAEPKSSPFPYDKSRLYIPNELPNYNIRDEDYFESIASNILDIYKDTQGGTLVLFTAKKDLDSVFNKLKLKIDSKPLYRGMRSDQTKKIIRKFKKDGGIILGTGTFWEGLDLKGEFLTNLIIVRLPYPVPSPILTRKAKKTSSEEVYIPEMITKLRQGTGRLIRTKEDRGVCSILDSRMNVFDKRRELILDSIPFKNIIDDHDDLKEFQKKTQL